MDDQKREDWDETYPYDTRALARYFFMNYFISEGKYPPPEGVHKRMHNTAGFTEVNCPGLEVVKKWVEKEFPMEIS